MMQFKKMVPLVFSVLMAGQLSAQTPVTLQDALHYALKNSQVVRQARIDIDQVAEKIVETRSAALPRVDITSSLTNNLIVQQFVLPAEAFGGAPGEFMAIKAGQPWSAMSQVQLSQQIFNQQVFTGLKAARGTKEYYELAAQVSEENVLQQVAANFYQVVITHEQLKVADANLDRVTKLEEMTRTQYTNGLAKKIDLDRILVNKSNIETQKLQLENAVSQQESLLKYYMGMPVSEDIRIVSETTEQLEVPERIGVITDPLNVKNLLSFRMLDKQEELLTLQRKATMAEGLPTLSLGAGYTYNTQSSKFDLYTKKSLSYDMSNVNLTLKIPVFDGFNRRARRKQTEFDIQKLQEDMSKTQNSLYMNYSNAQKQLANSLKAINTQKSNKKLAEDVLFSTQNNYKNGLASLTDLLNAESELVTAQNSYNEAILNYKVAEVELIKSKGEIKSLLDK